LMVECPQKGIPSNVVFPEDRNELEGIIRKYLNEGGESQNLLNQFNRLKPPYKYELENRLEFISVDITGDSVDELIVIADFYWDEESGTQHESIVWVYRCSAGTYQEGLYIAGGYFGWNPQVVSVEDLNGYLPISNRFLKTAFSTLIRTPAISS